VSEGPSGDDEAKELGRVKSPALNLREREMRNSRELELAGFACAVVLAAIGIWPAALVLFGIVVGNLVAPGERQ
jgi:hypothetical protein